MTERDVDQTPVLALTERITLDELKRRYGSADYGSAEITPEALSALRSDVRALAEIAQNLVAFVDVAFPIDESMLGVCAFGHTWEHRGWARGHGRRAVLWVCEVCGKERVDKRAGLFEGATGEIAALRRAAQSTSPHPTRDFGKPPAPAEKLAGDLPLDESQPRHSPIVTAVSNAVCARCLGTGWNNGGVCPDCGER